MATQISRGECIWAECGRFCEMLEGASVPLDSKWPYLILYLRGLKDDEYLSEIQKASMQELMLSLFAQKDFSHTNYRKITKALHAMVSAPFEHKLAEVMREATALTAEVNKILGRQKQQVITVAENVDADLARGKQPASILAELRDALRDVAMKMEQDASVLTELSLKDSLTGLANRRSLDAFLEETIRLWREESRPASLLILDLDHFKNFNDTYGHLVGDQVLKTLAAQLKKIATKLETPTSQCLAARYGGEEFVLVLRGDVAQQYAEIAEKVRVTISQISLRLRDAAGKVVENGLQVTVSVGAAALWSGWKSAYQTNLIDSADKALYHAKAKGRNCSVAFTPKAKDQYTLLTKK